MRGAMARIFESGGIAVNCAAQQSLFSPILTGKIGSLCSFFKQNTCAQVFSCNLQSESSFGPALTVAGPA